MKHLSWVKAALFGMVIALGNLPSYSQPVDIRGTVVNRYTALPLIEATVRLKSLDVKDTTDSLGRFHLFQAPTSRFSFRESKSKSMGFAQEKWVFTAIQPGTFSVQLAGLDGKKVAHQSFSIPQAGAWQIRIGGIDKGFYFALLEGPGVRFSSPVLILTDHATQLQWLGGSANLEAGLGKVAAGAPLDTLIIEKEGYPTQAMPLQSLQQSDLDVTLKDTLASLCRLTSLTASAGNVSPVFSPTTSSYAVSVREKDSLFYLFPKAMPANPWIRIEDSLQLSGSDSMVNELKRGFNDLNIHSVSLDSVCQMNYAVKVHRAFDDSTALKSLSFVGGTLEPAFNPSIYAYRIVRTKSSQDYMLNAEAFQPLCVMELSRSPLSSGTLSTPIYPTTDSIRVELGVRSPNLSKVTRYTVDFIRLPTPGQDVSLSKLIVSPLPTNSYVFDTKDFVYSMWMEGFDSVVTITPTTTDPQATMTIFGLPQANNTPFTVTLPIDAMQIPIYVTSADGSKVTGYHLYFHRPKLYKAPTVTGPDTAKAGFIATVTVANWQDSVCVGPKLDFGIRYNFGDTARGGPIMSPKPGQHIYVNPGEYFVKAQSYCYNILAKDSIAARSYWSEPKKVVVVPTDSVPIFQ